LPNFSQNQAGVDFDPEFVAVLRATAADSSVDELHALISARMEGRTIPGLSLQAGSFVYRARKVEPSFGPSQASRATLGYPPKEACRLNRLNRDGRPILYCGLSKSPLLYECGAKVGDEFVMSIWKLTQPALVTHIGYAASTFEQLGSQRQVPNFDKESTSGASVDALSDLFSERVTDDQRHHYKITAAIAEVHYGRLRGEENKIAGVVYPSVRGAGNSDNVALLPWFADANLELTKALHFRVTEINDLSFAKDDLNEGFPDCDGNISWTSRGGVIVLDRPGGSYRATFTKGPDQFGDYQHGRDCDGHWKIEHFPDTRGTTAEDYGAKG